MILVVSSCDHYLIDAFGDAFLQQLDFEVVPIIRILNKLEVLV